MESEYFMNARVPLSLPTWQSLGPVLEMQSNDETQDCFFNENWDKSTDHALNFDSALSSIVSSPAASNSNVSNESFMIRELIGKLGSINNNSGMVSPHSQPILAPSYMGTGNNSANNSCYSTPLSSPPKLNLPGMDQFSKESLNLPSLGKPQIGLNSSVAEFTTDPGFAERAARFSCFGSRSFNGRSNHFGTNNNAELGYRTSPLTGNGKLPRVSSSSSLKENGSFKGNSNTNINSNQSCELANSSQEESSLSVQEPNGDNGFKASNVMNSRKRKAASKSKAKEPVSTTPTTPAKDAETNDNSIAKRPKSTESSPVKGDEDAKENGDEKQNNKSNSKPPEPPKDYIHVRARRGQATDSHSLAERVRREKISERMKLLQDLVPGCNRVTGKALMLDEIINYVQSLQRQVEFLSMKLASVNTRLDFNMDTPVPKVVFPNNQFPHPIFPTDSLAAPSFGQQSPALHRNISNGTLTECSVDPSDSGLCQNINLHLPSLDSFNHTLPQFPTFCGDDLQTIVQMGLGQNLNQEAALQPPELLGPNQTNHMKVEL